MNQKYNKFYVALAAGVVGFLANYYGYDSNVTVAVVGVLGALGVYQVKNEEQ